ncbi:MAG: aminotransferase class IV [Chitinophagaceae bacterium]|nr:aminotransferase class IV [Chitinophagaceae bacterium]
MSTYAVVNGKILKEEAICISPNNRSFRYGDGFFETIKVVNQKINLKDYHFARLFSSLPLLGFDQPANLSPGYFENLIEQLVIKNNHQKLARVRITIYRGDGGVYDQVSHYPNHLIQSWPLQTSINQLNENGLVTDVYTRARKVCDEFSFVKSNNYLCYAMAALWAKSEKLNDCLLTNPYNFIADSTIANVFIVHDGIIKTPPLSDGPVSGVTRKYLIEHLPSIGMPCVETSLTVGDIQQASEVFFTNAIYGIKWVKSFGDQQYTHTIAAQIHKQLIEPLPGL